MVVLEQAPRQRDVLFRIAELEVARQPITTQRLVKDLGIHRQNIRQYLLALRDKGLIQYEAEARQRAHIALTQEGRGLTESAAYPVMGSVAAGQPILAEAQPEQFVTRLDEVLNLQPGDFLLRVQGDSMIGAGIYEDDLVAIRPLQTEPLSGEIVLVLLLDEHTATLKRWTRQGGVVSLLSENPGHAPITFPADRVKVQGSLVGHIGTGRGRRTTCSLD